MKQLRDWLIAATLSFGFYLFTINCVIRMGVVKGGSMEPTYHEGDKFIVYPFKLFFRPPIRNEVVVLIDNNNYWVIKRVIQLPGEVDIYSPKSNRVLAANEYIVLGDNRNGSTDSREYGPVKLKQFIGVVQ